MIAAQSRCALQLRSPCISRVAFEAIYSNSFGGIWRSDIFWPPSKNQNFSRSIRVTNHHLFSHRNKQAMFDDARDLIQLRGNAIGIGYFA